MSFLFSLFSLFCFFIKEVGKEKRKSLNFFHSETIANLWACVFDDNRYPKTASGKIQKFKLRDMGMEMLRRG